MCEGVLCVRVRGFGMGVGGGGGGVENLAPRMTQPGKERTAPAR